MNPVSELFEKAVGLREPERAALAGLLIGRLENDVEPDARAEWAAEIEQRLSELDSGQVESVPWENVRARLPGGGRA